MLILFTLYKLGCAVQASKSSGFGTEGHYPEILSSIDESLITFTNISSKNGQWPMAGCKNQLKMKYHSKLLVSNICYIEIILCIKKFTIVNKHFGWDSLSRNMNNNQHI